MIATNNCRAAGNITERVKKRQLRRASSGLGQATKTGPKKITPAPNLLGQTNEQLMPRQLNEEKNNPFNKWCWDK